MDGEKLFLGWREWVALPSLGISRIKAKVDTGARTSALHAFDVDTFTQDELEWARFYIHPMQKSDSDVVCCSAVIVDYRSVRDSGGHSEMRYVVQSDVTIGPETFPIEITLTSRDDMGFRMLLGRTALGSRYVVDPSRSYLSRRKKTRKPKERTPD